MADPARGEVWLVDLGMAAKIRPCLILSIPPGDRDRALVTAVPHTTSVRHSTHEVAVIAKFLRQGAFDAQNLVTVPRTKLMRKLGEIPKDQLVTIESAVRLWLGL